MQDPEFVKQAFTDIADRYVVTNHVLSGGIDILWRKKVAKQVAALKPERVLDLATGSGDLAMEILKKAPDTHVTGGDFCEPMLDVARRRGLKDLVVADGMDLPFEDESYDVITIGFGLRNMADWPLGIREMARVLKPGGTLMVLDFSLPKGSLRRKGYRVYLHSVMPRVAGIMTGKGEAYSYLAGSIEQFPSGEEMCDLLCANGFSRASSRELTFGIASIYTAVK